MTASVLEIRDTTAEVAFDVYQQIPEFDDSLVVTRDEFVRRLTRPASLALVALLDGRPVGFKLGYDRYSDGSWYSWLGGTLPDHRKQGVAEALLQRQEKWVCDEGFQRLYVKTRNRFAAMRALLAGSGYQVVAVESPEGDAELLDLRILMVKRL